MVIKEKPEGNPVLDHTILTPVSPRTIVEPLPRQVFQPQLSSTLTPHTPVVPEEVSAQRIHDWYLQMAGPDPQLEAPLTPIDPLWSALPGTPFCGPYPSFEATQERTLSVTWERTPSVTPQLF